MIYLLSVIVSFVAVFLKGFQHKNVIGGHLKTVFVTSYLMATFDVAAVSIIVIGGWPVALTSGTGASFGMIAAIMLHDKIFRRVVDTPKSGWYTRLTNKERRDDKLFGPRRLLQRQACNRPDR